MTQTISVRLGDCVEVLRTMEANSVGAFVCDPPYGILFMGRTWDDLSAHPEEASSGGLAMQKNHEVWLAEAFRTLEPGGVIKAFSGTRTFHRLAAAMRAVGFVDLNVRAWCYGSGFPKSLDISKATDEDRFRGWGTALKPSWEPILVGRKP